jgi:glycosyltransferase involved in cell wall biosynthesis
MNTRANSDETGIVIIGRNEGERLIGCLTSVKSYTDRIVYVDSGSTDGSATAAERLGGLRSQVGAGAAIHCRAG